MLKQFQNKISYCDRCSSTVYWDNKGYPSTLKLGNNDVKTCLETGCSLIWYQTPKDFSGPGQMELFRLALIQAGILEEDANAAVAHLGFEQTRLAA